MKLQTNALLVFLAFFIFSCSKTKETRIDIINLNSMNGYIFPSEKKEIKLGGISLISQQIKKIKQKTKNNNPLLIANSNFIYGSIETYFTEGEAMINFLNKLHCKALVIGHREYYFGEKVLKNLSEMANFPFISANITDLKGNPLPYIKPYIKDKNNNWAIIGFSSYMLEETNISEDVKKIKVRSIKKVLPKYIKELKKQGVKKIFLAGDITHEGKLDSRELAEFNKAINIQGIDYFLTRCKKYDNIENKPLVLKNKSLEEVKLLPVGNKGRTLGHYEFCNNKEHYTIYKINSKQLKPDLAMTDELSKLTIALSKIGGKVIGNCKRDLTHNFKKESLLGNFITDAIRFLKNYDAVLYNSGSMRKKIKKGDITLLDIYGILPWGGTLVEIDITGEQLLKVLESSCAYKLEKSFLQVSGIKFQFDSSKKPMHRVIKSSVYVSNKPLKLNKMYRMATGRYIFDGGDHYSEFKEESVKLVSIYHEQIRTIVKKYITNKKNIDSTLENRIIDINLH